VPVTIFEFGDLRLDCSRFELWRAGRSLKLERKPMELLILLATREGDLVTRAEIAERLWGSEVFVDTEHGINTAIRKIRQTLRDDPEEPRFVQTVMGKGYRFIGPISEVHPPPSTLHLEPVAPGVIGVATTIPTPQSSTSETGPPSHRPQPRPWLLIGASAVILCCITALTLRAHWSRERSARAATTNIQSIAVLPLDNLSGDPAQNYFADGMTDELTTMLAKNSTLHVTSRTSAMQYKGAHRPLREIAQALGVDGILEGSVERSDGKVHMTIQLIQASTDTHLWADSYERDANDVVTLPSEAAEAIAKRLNSAVAPPASARYINPEAHDAYLHGRYLWFREQYEKSADYFRKATELQPDYALGWTGLADYYGAGVIDGNLDPRTALPAESAAARKAIALDDSLAQAHLSLAAAYWMSNWDPVRADQEAQRAIEIDPKFAEAHHLRAKFLSMLNRHPDAIEAQKKAMELDPFGRPWAMAYIYILARQYDASITDALQRLESTPNDPTLHGILFWAYRCKGREKEAVQELERYFTLSGENTSAENVRRTYAQGGYKPTLYWQIRDLERKSAKQYVSPVEMALLYAQLGQREKTLALLEEGYRQHSPQLLDIQNDPAYDFLHADPRYRSLIRRIGLPPAWQ
jgi:TolB-like protein/DNA-binding winged helix-turn-helix (wHTH) protein